LLTGIVHGRGKEGLLREVPQRFAFQSQTARTWMYDH
jgi:hypothetical protein